MEALKVCKSCGVAKPRTDFHNTGWHTRKDGTRSALVKPECKTCANVAVRDNYASMLNRLVPKWACVKCGYDKCQAALEFHHVESQDKDFTVAQRYSVSFEKLRTEIEKCILVCANCHREIHAGILGD